MRKFLANIVLSLIELIERYEYRNTSFKSDDDTSDKIIETILADTDLYVMSDSGPVPVSHLHKTKPFNEYYLELENGMSITCADNHWVFDSSLNKIFVKDIKRGYFISTKDGPSKVIDLYPTGKRLTMFDATVDHPDHRLYTNGILSSNTIMAAIFIAWYIRFHYEKNALIIADIADTTKEIIDKTKNIIYNLPFFMKPGIVTNNVMSMKFDNGSRIIGRTTTKKSGIGLNIHLLYLDEFAHINEGYLNFFYRTVYPTISAMKNSRLIITSTPNGTNRFHDLWMGAIEGTNDYHPMRIDWWQVEGRDEAWKQEQIDNLGSEDDFNQEYGLQFFASDNLLLDSNDVKKLYDIKTKYVSRNIDELTVDKVIGQPGGTYKTVLTNFSSSMYWHPKFLETTFRSDMSNLRYDPNYYIFAIDTAKGVNKDYSVINIFKLAPLPMKYLLQHRPSIHNEFDCFGLIQVGYFRSNRINIDTLSNIVLALIFNVFNYNKIRVVLELNHQGFIVKDRVEKHGLYWPGLLIHTKHSESDQYYEPGLDLNSNKKKLEYCESFQHLVSLDRIIPNDVITIGELGGFGSNKNKTVYRCQTGNDDMAMTCVDVVSFFKSPQYYELCEEVYDMLKITNPNYIKAFEDQILEYNRRILEKDHGFDFNMLNDMNS